MIPAIAILKPGTDGALAGLIQLVSSNGQPDNAMYFWLTGVLSSFLDNAPTYVVFFNTAGGNAQALMRDAPATLAAISAGAVFIGQYLHRQCPQLYGAGHSRKPGRAHAQLFGYMLWIHCVLLPLFLLLTWLFF